MNPKIIAVPAAVVLAAGIAFSWSTRAPASAAPVPTASETDQTPPQGPEPEELLLTQRSKGEDDAPIRIFEMGDFQCPACRTFWAQTIDKLVDEYVETGKVKITFINFPLASIHPNAPAAHEFAMCSAKQDKFWEMHDLLYRHQEKWARLDNPADYFWVLPDSADLDRDQLEECVESTEMRNIIQAEAQLSYRSGLSSTPSFVVEGGVISGAAPIEVWRPILDSIYTAKTAPDQE